MFFIILRFVGVIGLYNGCVYVDFSVIVELIYYVSLSFEFVFVICGKLLFLWF